MKAKYIHRAAWAAVLIVASCSADEPGADAEQAAEEPDQNADAGTDGCQCMCSNKDPLSPSYACQPEWYSCLSGRQCEGDCEAAGKDVYVCGSPPGGGAWAPPNCTELGPGCRPGTLRFCCSCE